MRMRSKGSFGSKLSEARFQASGGKFSGGFQCLNRSRCGHDISRARGVLLPRERSSSVSRRERNRLSVPVDNRCASIQWYLGCKYPRSISRIPFLIMPASREFPESEIEREHNGRPVGRHEGKLISERRDARPIKGTFLRIGRGKGDCSASEGTRQDGRGTSKKIVQ